MKNIADQINWTEIMPYYAYTGMQPTQCFFVTHYRVRLHLKGTLDILGLPDEDEEDDE